MDSSIIVPITVAIVMAVPGIYAAFVQMKREKANIIDTVQKAAMAIIEPMREEIERLNQCNDRLEKELADKERRIAELEAMCGRVGELERVVANKESRIIELERLVNEKDAKIRALQDEIDNLTERIEIVEKRKRPIPPLKMG